MDSGLSFDASSEVFWGEDLALAARSGKVRIGSRSVWEKGVKRVEPRRERDGGDSFIATTDSSIKQQYHTAFCALKHMRSSANQPFILTVGSHSMIIRKCLGGRPWPLWLEVARSGVGYKNILVQRLLDTYMMCGQHSSDSWGLPYERIFIYFGWTSGIRGNYWMRRPASIAGSLELLFLSLFFSFWDNGNTAPFHVFSWESSPYHVTKAAPC